MLKAKYHYINPSKNQSNKTDDESVTICICDEIGVHYPCPICGKLYDDEMDAMIKCCLPF